MHQPNEIKFNKKQNKLLKTFDHGYILPNDDL